ncbi:MAG: tetratricopeptide repeat-containing sensor histidine kinase [Chitinophagales bacterium]|nr:tetratricopeptide repeat-containing sensor histidine kinase [Chitinophagales bacterium]
MKPLVILPLFLLGVYATPGPSLKVDSLYQAGKQSLYNGNYNDAFNAFIAIENLSESSRDSAMEALALRYLGEVCRATRQFDLGLNYLHDALAIAVLRKDTQIIAESLNRISAIKFEMKGVNEATDLAEQSLRLSEQRHDIRLQASNLNILGAIYTGTGQFEKAASYYERARAATLLLPEKDQADLPNILYNMANNLYQLGNYREGLVYAKEAFDYASKNHVLAYELEATRMMLAGYKGLGDFENALVYSEKVTWINEQFMTELKNAEGAVIELKYKNEEAKKENTSLKQIIAENERLMRIQRTSFIYIMAGLVLISTLLVLVLLLNRQRKKNLTELRERNAMVENQKKELVELNMLKDRLLSVISHDFRSPLVTLHAMMELADPGIDSGKDMNMLVQNIRKHLHETLVALDNIIYWSRSQMEGFQLRNERIAIRSLADSVAASFLADIRTKELTVHNEVSDSHFVTCDRDLLMLVIRNLMTNAIKFSHRGGSIFLSSQSDDGHISISVRDEGTGISSAVQEKLHLNQQVSTPGTGMEKGTGMGLVLSKELVMKMGGAITIQSSANHGSIFTVMLPRNTAG